MPEYICVTEYYNVCANSLITKSSWKLLQRYHRVWKHNNETDSSYNKCPVIMETAMDIIEPEVGRIKMQLRKDAELDAKRGHR